MSELSRLVHRPIMVWLKDEKPHFLRDGDITHTIAEIVDTWSEMGEWWSGEPERKLYRVMTERCYVFDIEQSGGEWFIYRVWD